MTEASLSFARRRLRSFESGAADYLLLEPGGRLRLLQEALAGAAALILFRGSFDPVHRGHVALFEAARSRHPEARGAFALAVEFGGRRLPTAELLFRARLIRRAGYPVVLSRSGYFRDDVRWLLRRAPDLRVVFPVGADTLGRMLGHYPPERFADHFGGAVFECADRGPAPGAAPADRHPLYSGFRRLRLDGAVSTLSSSSIRESARAGRADEVAAAMPPRSGDLYLRRRRGRRRPGQGRKGR